LFEAANRSLSQFVMTTSRKRAWRRASASAESGNAGQSPTEPPKQDLAVAQVRAGLERGLVARVALEQLVVGGRDAVGVDHAAHRREEPGLPVDQRPVAVEGQGVEPVEVERHPREASITGILAG
jgi:hypothetical protein